MSRWKRANKPPSHNGDVVLVHGHPQDREIMIAFFTDGEWEPRDDLPMGDPLAWCEIPRFDIEPAEASKWSARPRHMRRIELDGRKGSGTTSERID